MELRSDWKKVLEENQKFEQECIEAAKRELEREANSPIDYVVKLMERAQAIKIRIRGQ